MGGKQSLEETDAPASPRSPTSPRVLPVDGETSMSAVQDKDASRGSDALDDAKKDKSDDPNRLNYTINAVEAIVENRTRKLEAELAATREKIDTLTAMIQKLLDKEQS